MAATVETLFATPLYRARLGGPGERGLIADLAAACRAIAADDVAGQAWSARHGYRGYTSYASLNDLSWRDPAFAALEARLSPHVAAFAQVAEFDLGGRPLALDSLWINVLEPGGVHTGHIHPNAAVSGTLYLETPEGAAPIRFEDPRLPLMMAAPPRKARAKAENRRHVSVAPAPGVVLLWESWLRHEVPLNDAAAERVSVSFNYRWG
ncbi:MAG: TIGR02466 family protein [Hyphomonadaceae bacterium]|nr:TIGR02466 family protein [Hyphomonadaceae bacterium]